MQATIGTVLAYPPRSVKSQGSQQDPELLIPRAPGIFPQ